MALHILKRTFNSNVWDVNRGRRPFFYWLMVMFNRVDKDRVKEVGPDVACAEWLLRNGAFVRWKDTKEYLTDYNKIDQAGQYIEAIDATESAICDVGFPHLDGCRYIREIKLVRCKYVDDRAIRFLPLVKDSLLHLEVAECKAVTEQGLYHLKELQNLHILKLSGMPYIKDKSSIEKELKKALPKCSIDFR